MRHISLSKAKRHICLVWHTRLLSILRRGEIWKLLESCALHWPTSDNIDHLRLQFSSGRKHIYCFDMAREWKKGNKITSGKNNIIICMRRPAQYCRVAECQIIHTQIIFSSFFTHIFFTDTSPRSATFCSTWQQSRNFRSSAATADAETNPKLAQIEAIATNNSAEYFGFLLGTTCSIYRVFFFTRPPLKSSVWKN